MATKHGVIKKTDLVAYSRPRQNGIIAIGVRDGDNLIQARLTDGSDHLILAVRSGKAIRFPEDTVRPMGRTASGVRGIKLKDKYDEVVGMVCVDPEKPDTTLLVVSEKGYGKRTFLDDYRITNRGGKGVKTINITERTGALISIKSVTDDDDLMIINRTGITIRLAVEGIRVAGRATQGVKLINLREGDSIAAVASVIKTQDMEDIAEAENEESPQNEENSPDTDE